MGQQYLWRTALHEVAHGAVAVQQCGFEITAIRCTPTGQTVLHWPLASWSLARRYHRDPDLTRHLLTKIVAVISAPGDVLEAAGAFFSTRTLGGDLDSLSEWSAAWKAIPGASPPWRTICADAHAMVHAWLDAPERPQQLCVLSEALMKRHWLSGTAFQQLIDECQVPHQAVTPTFRKENVPLCNNSWRDYGGGYPPLLLS